MVEIVKTTNLKKIQFYWLTKNVYEICFPGCRWQWVSTDWYIDFTLHRICCRAKCCYCVWNHNDPPARDLVDYSEPVKIYIVMCRYNAVEYDLIWKTSLQWLRQSINQSLNPQNTPHTSPWRASYGICFVRILNEINHVITTPHFIY